MRNPNDSGRAEVMVKHDDVEAKPVRRRDRFEGRGAAIDRHDKACASLPKLRHGFWIGAIAFLLPVGHVEDRFGAIGA